MLFVGDVREEKESLEEGRVEEGRVEESRPEECRLEEGRIEEGRLEEGRIEAEKSPSQEGARSCEVRRPGRIVQAQGDGVIEARASAQATRARLQMSDNASPPR